MPSPGARNLSWLTERPVAHRGLHDVTAGIIENTESAVQAALDAGYAVEVDVQFTSDGEAVVFHDYSLDRLTEESGLVRARTAADLRRASFKACGDRIQTLSELLEQVAGRATLMIEIKSGWHEVGPLEERVVEIVREYDGPAAIMSFDPQSVAMVRALAPELPRGLVAERFASSPEWRRLPLQRRLSLRHGMEIADANPHFLHFHVKGLPYGPTRLFRKLGRPILTWTVRTEADRRKAARYADQIVFEGFRP
ncbi:MAG: glycerophosphodiester phosphodiesterase family protein [Pseudomonadota bacterium]